MTLGSARSPAAPLPAAVLFDMDGLLVDSEPVWSVAEAEIMAWLGGPWNLEVKAALLGKRIDEGCRVLVDLAGSAVPPEAVEERLLARMCELFRTDLPVLPGALDLLDELGGLGVPLGLVSSSARALVAAALETIGAARFAVTVTGDDVANPKPDPEPYVRAAAALGADPGACVVLEDTETGARSAEAAGCPVVVVPNVVGVRPGPGRLVVASLVEVDAALLGGLVTKA